MQSVNDRILAEKGSFIHVATIHDNDVHSLLLLHVMLSLSLIRHH